MKIFLSLRKLFESNNIKYLRPKHSHVKMEWNPAIHHYNYNRNSNNNGLITENLSGIQFGSNTQV